MTTPLLYLRCLQIGLSISDLDLVTIGMVTDMFIEQANDEVDDSAETDATQEDFDRF